MRRTVAFAKDLIKHKKINLVSNSNNSLTYQVDDHLVRVFSRKGARLITCDCENHTRNCSSPAWCVHKSAIFIYESEKDFHIQMDKLIDLWEFWKKNGIPVTIDTMIYDLKNLKELQWK